MNSELITPNILQSIFLSTDYSGLAKKCCRLVYFFILLICTGTVVKAALPDSLYITKRASGLKNPVWIGEIPGQKGNFLLLEQHTGKIIRLQQDGAGELTKSNFLILDSMYKANESGLLGMAFHPKFIQNGKYYLNYNRKNANTIIEERLSNKAVTQDSGNARRLMYIVQPEDNHQGGHIAFGPDGYLYIGMGDGGGGGDPHGPLGNGQNNSVLLGKLLRINVDTVTESKPYGIPADNPFVNQASYAPEIWATGLRNPWKFSWDRLTEALWVGDVGQVTREEISIVKKGENHGWKVMEGNHCYIKSISALPPCNDPAYTKPVLDLNRALSISVTGGYVYRGNKSSKWYGAYLFTDFYYSRGKMFVIDPAQPDTFKTVNLSNSRVNSVSAYSEDSEGRLYILDHTAGDLWRLELDRDVTPLLKRNKVSSFKWSLAQPSRLTVWGAPGEKGLVEFFDLSGKLWAQGDLQQSPQTDKGLDLRGYSGAGVLRIQYQNIVEQTTFVIP